MVGNRAVNGNWCPGPAREAKQSLCPETFLIRVWHDDDHTQINGFVLYPFSLERTRVHLYSLINSLDLPYNGWLSLDGANNLRLQSDD